MLKITAVINQQPQVGFSLPVFFTYIDSNSLLQQATITEMTLLYGNANINANSVVPTKANQLAVFVNAVGVNSIELTDILYVNPVPINRVPNSAKALTQCFPKGVFKGFGKDTIVGNIVNATAGLLNDYYGIYFAVLDEVYSTAYSSSAEYQYNGTVGLLSNSFNPNGLFLLLFRLKQVKLTSYRLELFISQYVYYRMGISCPVYINDGINSIADYWVENQSALNINTKLAPAQYIQAITNLEWTIYNSSSFTAEFQQELTLLINRISRCDLGNPVTFSAVVNPVTDGFILIGPSYEYDPNTIYGKCIQFTGDDAFPLNIIAYIKGA